MRVRIRSYCYGCRAGKRWGRCLWTSHRRSWEYQITCDGRRLYASSSYRTWDRAYASAQWTWAKLTALSCITSEGTP